jgi:hypothetical protein
MQHLIQTDFQEELVFFAEEYSLQSLLKRDAVRTLKNRRQTENI